MEPTEFSYYDQLASTLALAGVDISVSEMHGCVCGTLCNRVKTKREPEWMALLSAGSEASQRQLDTLRRPLETLYRSTMQDLQERRPEFDLLLPAPESGVSIRGGALAEWCRGFLLGLLHGGSPAVDELPGDAAEIVRDLLAISDMEDVSADTGENEWALAELEQYVRVGVQLIFAELDDADSGVHSGQALRH